MNCGIRIFILIQIFVKGENMMTKRYEEELGFIPEAELTELVSDEKVGGATPAASSWACVIAIVGVTLSAGICPTSACSKDCPWNKK